MTGLLCHNNVLLRRDRLNTLCPNYINLERQTDRQTETEREKETETVMILITMYTYNALKGTPSAYRLHVKVG